MPRLALALAFGALIAVALPSPGLYVALGLGVGAVGTGWAAYGDRAAPGFQRLAGAAAMTLGMLGVLLGAVRVVLVLAAIRHLNGLLG